jgi:SHS2 domain-containing protein
MTGLAGPPDMTEAPRYRLLDHTADLAFEVEAADWPGLLAAATAALGDVLLAGDDVPAILEKPVQVTGADREDVLVAWLTEAVVLYEMERFLVRAARVAEATTTVARGVLVGRRSDPDVEPPDRVVKAVTYHDLHVVPGDGDRPWRAVIVLDL